MRVFTFLLMVTVATVGGLGGYRLITGKDLLPLPKLFVGQLVATPVASPTPYASPVPTAWPSPTTTPTPPSATPTPEPDRPEVMVVGNTDGQGVYLRRTPHPEDKLKAWVDGTRMEILGPSEESEGRAWRKVRAPDGEEGYLPEEYLVEPSP